MQRKASTPAIARRTALLLLGLITSCSWTSEDPRSAYYAALGQELPGDAAVIRARLWENRHLFVFYEFESSMELRISDEALQRVMAATGLKFERFDPSMFGLGPGLPTWFAPKGPRYEGWRSVPTDLVYVVREVGSDRVFVTRAEL